MKRILWRTLIVCALVAMGGGLAAAEMYTYIVVLHDRAAAEGQGEPDIGALGGELLHRSEDRRVVRVPSPAARALAAHRAVKFMQRVQTEGEVPPLPEPAAIAATAVAASDWSPSTWASGRYVYDGEGNITAIGTAANPASDGGAETYVYDSAGRLASASIAHGTTESEQYTYDSFGNLVATTRTAGPSTSTPASLATNRLATATYDSAGNVTANESGSTEYQYDGFNMLRAKATSTGAAWYVYTADDERIGAFENSVQRWMIRDLSGKVLREWRDAGLVWMWREDHIYRNGTLAAAEREPAEGGTRHFHLDHLGTPRLITDQAKLKIALHDYFPFGVEKTDFRQEMLERGTKWPEPMKFTGHERDFTGGISTDNRNQLDYMHARYYSAVWGRFLSVDPGRDWDLRQPQSWNMYSYVRNNPLRYVDPTGRAAEDPEKKPKRELKPEPEGGPPVPVPGAPEADWKFNPNPENKRGGSYGPTKPVKGTGGGQPSASWEGGATVPHWDVDDGTGKRRRYDENGNFITPEQAHGKPSKRSTTLSAGEVLGLIGASIVGTAILIMTGGSATLQPATGVIIVPTNPTQYDPDKECPTCA